MVPPSAAAPGAQGKRGDGNACGRGSAEAPVLGRLHRAGCHSESLSEAPDTGQARPAIPRDAASVRGAGTQMAGGRQHPPSPPPLTAAAWATVHPRASSLLPGTQRLRMNPRSAWKLPVKRAHEDKVCCITGVSPTERAAPRGSPGGESRQKPQTRATPHVPQTRHVCRDSGCDAPDR